MATLERQSLIIVGVVLVCIGAYLIWQKRSRGTGGGALYMGAPAPDTLFRGEFDILPLVVYPFATEQASASGIARVPPQFDARLRWPGSARAIREQLTCGACWAAATTTMAAWRFFIKSNGRVNKEMSIQRVLDCNKNCKRDTKDCIADLGCKGGTIVGAASYARDFGFVDEKCVPFKRKDDVCQTGCVDPSRTAQRYRFTDVYQLVVKGDPIATTLNIQQDIVKHGPVAVQNVAYDSFYDHRGSGVYRADSGTNQGGHALVIIGWNELADIPYWIVHNSWGEKWANDGIGRLAMGANMTGIESISAVGGIPPIIV